MYTAFAPFRTAGKVVGLPMADHGDAKAVLKSPSCPKHKVSILLECRAGEEGDRELTRPYVREEEDSYLRKQRHQGSILTDLDEKIQQRKE